MPSEISWNDRQNRRITDEVRKFNSTVDKLKKSGLYDAVPNKTSVAKEKERIHTVQDLELRISEMERIFKKNKPNAHDPVEFRGLVVPRYYAEEMINLEFIKNADRRETRKADFEDWDKLTPQEQALHIASGNVADLYGTYVHPDDLDDLVDMEYLEKDAAYMSKYISAWREHCIFEDLEDDVIENIEWLYANRPDVIRHELDKGNLNAKIDFVYRDSADLSPVKDRQESVVKYWSDLRKEYE